MSSFSWIDWVVVVAGVIIAALIAVMQVRLQRNKATQHYKAGTHPGMAPEDTLHGKVVEPGAGPEAGRDLSGSSERDGGDGSLKG